MNRTRPPWSIASAAVLFNEMLIALPLQVSRAMYLEGGPEASLWVESGGVSLIRLCSFETSFNENDQNTAPWPLPNVIGVRRR